MKFISVILLILGAATVFSLIAALPVMLLWNWLLTDLLNAPEITFIQAWGLMFLCYFLFNRVNYKGEI